MKVSHELGVNSFISYIYLEHAKWHVRVLLWAHLK